LAEATACVALGVIRKLISLGTPGGDSRGIWTPDCHLERSGRFTRP